MTVGTGGLAWIVRQQSESWDEESNAPCVCENL
jgi:hypothetical protein